MVVVVMVVGLGTYLDGVVAMCVVVVVVVVDGGEGGLRVVGWGCVSLFCTCHRVYRESTRSPWTVFMESSWSPPYFGQSTWSLCGVSMESSWSPCGFFVDSTESSWTPWKPVGECKALTNFICCVKS